MKTFRIELIEIGRNDHSEILTEEFKDIEEAGQYAVEKAGSFLLSSDVSMSCDDGETFTVFAGFRPVGTVKIKELEEKENGK